MRKLAVVGLSLAAVALTPGLASAAPSWQSGTTDESSIENCYSVINGSPYLEVGAAATAYAYYDPAAPPPAGQTYYVAVTVFGLGNACAGQLADIEMALPPGTQPAITAQAPVRCRQMSIQNNAIVTSAPDTSGACPQNPTVGPHGGYSFDMAQNSGFGATPYYPLWPVPQTYGVEIDIPVVSSQHLGGSNSATAAVTMADGNFDPTLLPSVPLPATSGSTAGTNTAGTPSVINPQVTNITDHSATVQALVVNNYTDGTIETRYGTAVPYPYDQQLTDVASARTYQIERATAIDGLQPGCTYHWAIDLYSLNQIKATVADQTFTTLGTNTGSCAIGASTGSATGNHSFIYTTQPNAHAASTGTIGAPGTAPTPNVTLPQPQQQTGGGGGTPTGGGGSGDPGGGTTPNQPGGDGGGGSTTVVPAFSALALPAVQRGSALKLGLTIGTDGSAVSIKLYTPVVTRGGHNKKTSLVLAGKLARSGVGAGAQNFKVALNAAGKKLLKAHHKLALTVDVAVTPPGGKALTAKRKATLKR